MPTLTEFLLARIDEDATTARTVPPGAVRAVGYDADRLLAECDAKRRIVELAYEATGLDMTVDLDRAVTARADSGVEFVGERILRALALPYVHHPEFRPEWRL
ncbi:MULTISPECIES: DUF6221 family protein [unclassified Isoptericola]|uniref:DUF6221 family protein n=1 Tax=Isoptericola sp. NPDC057191 TaxID=3346041 RepID=UPI003632D1E6